MDAIKFVKAMNRMCDMDCIECPVSKDNNAYKLPCDELKEEHPQKYVAIVEKWAKEHPMPTNREKFMEIFAQLSPSKWNEKCMGECENVPCPDCTWWEEEYVEPDKH